MHNDYVTYNLVVGVQVQPHGTDSPFTMKLCVIGCTCDLPAKAMVQNLTEHMAAGIANKKEVQYVQVQVAMYKPFRTMHNPQQVLFGQQHLIMNMLKKLLKSNLWYVNEIEVINILCIYRLKVSRVHLGCPH